MVRVRRIVGMADPGNGGPESFNKTCKRIPILTKLTTAMFSIIHWPYDYRNIYLKCESAPIHDYSLVMIRTEHNNKHFYKNVYLRHERRIINNVSLSG